MKAREPKPDIAAALTVEHFCQMFGISEPLYRALRRNHLGPRDVRVGDVRFNAHCGLKSDIAACPKTCATADIWDDVVRKKDRLAAVSQKSCHAFTQF